MSNTLDDHIVDDRLLADRRGTTRMPQPGGCGQGTLRIGSKTKAVDILDESAGGFLVSVEERLPKISPSTPLELATESGRHPLVLVWRRSVKGTTRLGLQRLPEHMVWSKDSSWMIWMLVAIILGFCFGCIIAFRDHPRVATSIHVFSANGGQVVVNDAALQTPAPVLADE